MPIVQAKRRREVEEKLVQKAKRCKLNHYEMFSKIGYTEDHHHSLYREIPLMGTEFDKKLRREVGSFLNGSGGIIAFGARPNGSIMGNSLTRKEEDNFKLAVDRIMVGFHPIVKPSMYRLIIEPVYNKYNSWVGNNLFLIQLKVNKGEKYSLYEDSEHEVFVRSGSSPKGPLTAREIKERVMAEYNQRREIEKGQRRENERGPSIKTNTVTVKPAPKNAGNDILRKTNEERKKNEENKKETKMKTGKDTATSITIKVVPKTTETVKKEISTKVVTKATQSSTAKIRRPLATKN